MSSSISDRSIVARSILFIPASASESRSITATGHYASAYKINFPSNVDSGSLTVTVSNPESVSFDVDRLSTKSVEALCSHPQTPQGCR